MFGGPLLAEMGTKQKRRVEKESCRAQLLTVKMTPFLREETFGGAMCDAPDNRLRFHI